MNHDLRNLPPFFDAAEIAAALEAADVVIAYRDGGNDILKGRQYLERAVEREETINVRVFECTVAGREQSEVIAALLMLDAGERHDEGCIGVFARELQRTSVGKPQ